MSLIMPITLAEDSDPLSPLINIVCLIISYGYILILIIVVITMIITITITIIIIIIIKNS